MSKKFLMLKGENVVLIHNMPFDEINGFHKTEAELNSMGVLVDTIPEPLHIDGKTAKPMYDKIQGFHYIYEAIPLTREQQQMIDVESAIAELTYGGMK